MTDLNAIRTAVQNYFEEDVRPEGAKYARFRGIHTFEWDMTHDEGLTRDGMKFEFVEKTRNFDTGDIPEEQFIFSVDGQLYLLAGQSDSWEGGYPEWEYQNIQPVEKVEVTKIEYKVVR